MSERSFSGIIWTNHALERLDQRGLTQDLAHSAFTNPDKSYSARDGGMEFIKWVGKSKITLIAKKNERGEWLVISNWIDPPLEGTTDYYKATDYKAYKKMPWWAKLVVDIFSAVGSLFK